jgi:hypothetical protein
MRIAARRASSELAEDSSVSFQEEQETVANVVNTYFVEQSKPKARQLYQSSLSTHNIDVHNSLTAACALKFCIVMTRGK